MRGKVLLILMLFLIGGGAGNVLGLLGTCTTQSNYDELVCGATPNSVCGYGAVEICGNCYPCGASDNVCPEDFYSTVTKMQANCRLCPDPDCPATLEGYVFEKGFPVPNTDIVTTYNTADSIGAREVIATTNGSGYYSGTIRSGHHVVFTQFATFQGPNEEIELKRGEHLQFNFTINRGTCNADCTIGNTGVCSQSCNGQEGCVFPDYPILGITSAETASRCDGLSVSGETPDRVKLGTYENTTYRLFCCRGPLFNASAIKANPSPASATAASEKGIENSAKWSTPITWASEPGFFNILFGKK